MRPFFLKPVMHQLVYQGYTGQHPVLVTDESNLRSLRFGTEERQTCIDLQAPWELQLAYTRWMATALLLHPAPKRVLLFGLGGGALPHFLLRHHPEALIDVVEKEQLVIELAHRFFALPVHDNLRLINQDAWAFLDTDSSSTYQVAFLDIFGPGAMAPALYDSELYRAILDRLSPDGVLAVNLWSGDDALFYQALQAVKQGSNGQMMQMQVKKRSNSILLVFPGAIPHATLKRVRKNLPQATQRYGLNFHQYLKKLRRTNPLRLLSSLLG